MTEEMSLHNFLSKLLLMYEALPDKHQLAIGHSVPSGLFYHKIEPDLALTVGDLRRWSREGWELRATKNG